MPASTGLLNPLQGLVDVPTETTINRPASQLLNRESMDGAAFSTGDALAIEAGPGFASQWLYPAAMKSAESAFQAALPNLIQSCEDQWVVFLSSGNQLGDGFCTKEEAVAAALSAKLPRDTFILRQVSSDELSDSD